MLPKNFNSVTLKRAEENITGRMGLAWTAHALRDYGLKGFIDKSYTQKRRSNREIAASRKIEAGMLMLIAGGERIEDLEVLRADPALASSLGWDAVISADTLREFLKEKSNAAKLRQLTEELTVKGMRDSDMEEFTYDNDATYIDSNKRSAEYSYKGLKQFSGLLGFIPELGLCATADYRSGNISPCDGVLNQLRKVIKQAEKAGKRITRFRSDSAAHSNDIFRKCNSKSVKYYISMSKNLAIKEIISSLDENEWRKLSGRYEGKKREYAEAVYVTNEGESVRIMILRWPNRNRDLFNESRYCYHVIGTNDIDSPPMEWLEFHNGRMNSENCNKEIKSGFNCDYTPSHDFQMNRSYFLMGILAYNAVQIMKLFYLDERARKWTIKTLRYHFINVCGKIIKTARRYICKVINVTDNTFALYRRCLFHLKMG